MKQLFMIAIAAASLTSCNQTASTDTTTTVDSSATVTTTQTTTAPVAKDGDYMMKDNTVMVMKGGQWVVVTEPTTLPNGTVILANGEVKTNNGTTVTMANGERVNADGVYVDDNGVIVSSSENTAVSPAITLN